MGWASQIGGLGGRPMLERGLESGWVCCTGPILLLPLMFYDISVDTGKKASDDKILIGRNRHGVGLDGRVFTRPLVGFVQPRVALMEAKDW
jgi:hypothetical protein